MTLVEEEVATAGAEVMAVAEGVADMVDEEEGEVMATNVIWITYLYLHRSLKT